MAPTGSGKTLAFGLAILARLAAQPVERRRGRRRPTALVLVPTRELAAQIEEVISPLASAIGARVASIYGGVGYAKQLAALRGGVDVLVACPGRLTDLLERGSVDLSLVDVVVVDEADRMADMGFLPPVRRLIERTSDPRQTLLFSATLDGPVDKLIRDYLHKPARHDVQAASDDRSQVHHHFWRVEPNDRVAVTAETITAHGPAVVFCRTNAARTDFRNASPAPVWPRPPSTATAARASANAPSPHSVPAASTCWWQPISPHGGSTSMPSPSWSTSTHPPIPPTTCTARAVPDGPVPTGSSCPWSVRSTSPRRSSFSAGWASKTESGPPTSRPSAR